MENNIIISGLDMATITAADEARQHRDTLLALARKGTSIKDAAGAERATTILKDIKAFTRAIEDGRSAAKAPVLELGKKVDTLARDLTVELEAEATRISRLVGTFQQEQERIAAEARQRAFEEQERIRKEAEEKQRLADLEASVSRTSSPPRSNGPVPRLARPAPPKRRNVPACKRRRTGRPARWRPTMPPPRPRALSPSWSSPPASPPARK
jgi:hypothetical protein